MKKIVLILCMAGLLLASAPAAFAQAGQAEDPQGPPTPQPAPGAPGPQGGVMMRRGLGPTPAPTPMARPDLGKWWKNSEIAKELGLTEAQIGKIEQTFFDHRMQLIDMNADVQRNEARLQPLMEADQVDEVKISAQLDQMLAARSKLEKANMMMMISIRKVLSVEQWKKLEGIREERQRMHMKVPHPDGPDAPRGRMPYKQPGPPEDEN